ncbi:34762_t:CDS:2 [Gigaspora margarita]|uniref:34762_t:CDS:1 n=1 Tax=Gigaspora margarita TaxID=4874 RepID=A0ABN7UIP3_GIGMA|nr:34762_t:CDS:2 [Gigaspora margarita]
MLAASVTNIPFMYLDNMLVKSFSQTSGIVLKLDPNHGMLGVAVTKELGYSYLLKQMCIT